MQPWNCWLDRRVLVVDNRWEIGCLVRQLSVGGGSAFTVYFLGISVGKRLTVGTDKRAWLLFLANFLSKYRVSRPPRPKSSRWHNGCRMATTERFQMKVATQSYRNRMALGVGLTLVFFSPPFIRADADDLLTSQTSGAVIVLESPHRVTADSDVSKLSGEPGVELREQPKNGDINPTHAEYRPSQGLPVPSLNGSLLAVTRSTSPKGLAAMRFIEKARKLLKAGEGEKALATLEKALGLEANPYVYFYLSQVHYQLGHYQAALNFLEVAESWLDQQPDWSPQITALKAEIPGSGFVQQVTSGQITTVADH